MKAARSRGGDLDHSAGLSGIDEASMKGRPIKSGDRVPILGPVTARGRLPAALLAKGARVLATICAGAPE